MCRGSQRECRGSQRECCGSQCKCRGSQLFSDVQQRFSLLLIFPGMKIIDSKFIAANVAANATHGGNTLPPPICWINRAVIETQTHVCFMDFQNLISGEVGIRASWMEKCSEINKRGGDYSIPLEYHLKDFKKL